MSLAVVASKRSKDKETQVGAVIVSSDKRILGIGWNGHPKMSYGSNDKAFTWDKYGRENKHLYVCHAETNAIAHSSSSVKGATIYVTLSPCNECAKAIVQSGIKRVVYIEEKEKKSPDGEAKNKKLEAAMNNFRQGFEDEDENAKQAAMKIFRQCSEDEAKTAKLEAAKNIFHHCEVVSVRFEDKFDDSIKFEVKLKPTQATR